MENSPSSNDLKSTSHLEVAHALKEHGLAAIRKNPALGGEKVAERLGALMDAIWVAPEKQSDEKNAPLFEQALAGLGDEGRRQLLEGFARMGHLYEIAGLAARENFFASRRGGAPGGVETAIYNQKSVQDALKLLAEPVFEVIMTQHPTNTSALASIRAQRNIGLAIKNSGDVEKAVADYFETPLIQDVNFTVRDETDIVINALGNIYDDLPQVYAEFDRPLAKQFQEYRPEALELNIRLGSWGSAGDKDGNDNVTAEATLQAIALHKQAILERYVADLDRLAAMPGLNEGVLTDVQHLHEKLKLVLNGDGKRPGLGKLNEELEERRRAATGPFLMPEAEFDDFSRRLQALNAALPEKKEVLQILEGAIPNTQGQTQQEALNLLRRFRQFGFELAKIEYRETSEQYSRVANLLIDGYAEMREEQKREKLSELIAQPDKLDRLLHAKHELIEAGAEKPYNKEDATPIAYHTLKRMELARDFPEMVKDNVLAECKGVTNMLEAKLMQRMAKKDGRAPLMGIIPLFEDPDTMENIQSIMRDAYRNPAYMAHLKELGGQLTQQVQIAHSDNARRAGALAARGSIHRAHKLLYALHRQEEFKDINLQFFEGGSISDAYRNGVRAVSGTVDDFQLYNFAKFTFQGGDLVNYFNQPGSVTRLLSRSIAHQARRKWQTEHKNGNGAGDQPPVTNEVADEVAIRALRRTLEQYESEDFGAHNPMGAMLKLLDYDGESRAGNRGSRAAARRAEKKDPAAPVEVKDMRTIAFSEAWQHEGVIPIWIGGDMHAQWIDDEIVRKCEALEQKSKKTALNKDEQQFYDSFSEVKENGLWPQHVRALYKQSRVFKDAMDRAAYGVAMTDADSFDWLRHITQNTPHRYIGRKAFQYLHRLADNFVSMAPLTEAAHTDEARPSNRSLIERIEQLRRRALDEILGRGPDTVRDMRKETADTLDNMKEQVGIKRAYRDFLLHVRHSLEHGDSDDYWHLRGVIHNAGDTVVHGRVLPADDPAYGKALEEDRRKAAEQQTAMIA